MLKGVFKKKEEEKTPPLSATFSLTQFILGTSEPVAPPANILSARKHNTASSAVAPSASKQTSTPSAKACVGCSRKFNVLHRQHVSTLWLVLTFEVAVN